MQAMLNKVSARTLKDHPRFAGVRFAVLVSARNSPSVSVSLLEISPGVEVPVHTHDLQLDSIFVCSGRGEAFVNGAWLAVEPGDHVFAPKGAKHGLRNPGPEPVRLLVHHSPPLY